MAKQPPGKVPVTFAEGVKDDVAELIASSGEADASEREETKALKRRIAELFMECERNPYVGELMGPGRDPELADCRRVRFDIPAHHGKPRFRVIYRNEPSDGLRTHRKAQSRA